MNSNLGFSSTEELLAWVSHSSIILISIVSFLVFVLMFIKFISLAWARHVERTHKWMKPALEECILNKKPIPSRFYQIRWPVRRILQYVIVYRSFGVKSLELKRIAKVYDRLGFIQTDIKRLNHFFWWNRAEAARCLGQMRWVPAKPHLMKRLHDRSVEVKLMAAWALGRTGDPEIISLALEALVSTSRLAGMRLSSTVFELGKKAVMPLVATLNNRDPAVCILAVHLLGELGDRRAVAPMIEKTHLRECKEVRVAAFKALGTIADSSAIPCLIRGLRDPLWEVRAQAARGIGLTGSTVTAKHLIEALEDPKWWVRRNAGEALTKLGRKGERALLRVFREASQQASREMAAQWLDEIGLLPATH